VRQVLGEEVTPLTRLVELPGRGVTRVWECAGPPGAETLMLIHGVACTAELNWGKVFAPLAAHFRVVAADLRGHGDGIRAGWRFRLEDCADDVAALAAVLGTGKFTAVGYSMGSALLGPIDDPATARWARAQLRRTTLASVASAIGAVCEFSSDGWIGQVDVPAAVVVTTRDRIVPASRQLQLARAIPGAALHRVDADHAVCITAPQVFARTLLEACRAVQAGPGLADQRLSAA
jgi:3-oxoadipate enol-lactonase